MKLVCSAGLFLFLPLESADSRWYLRDVIIYDIDLLVDPIEFLKEIVALGFQFILGSLKSSLSTVQRFNFKAS